MTFTCAASGRPNCVTWRNWPRVLVSSALDCGSFQFWNPTRTPVTGQLLAGWRMRTRGFWMTVVGSYLDLYPTLPGQGGVECVLHACVSRSLNDRQQPRSNSSHPLSHPGFERRMRVKPRPTSARIAVCSQYAVIRGDRRPKRQAPTQPPWGSSWILSGCRIEQTGNAPATPPPNRDTN